MNIIVNKVLYNILMKFEKEQLLKNKINIWYNPISENYLFKKYKQIQKENQKIIDENLHKFFEIGRKLN